jgi:D-alanyl-D-alanine carboxypeptidase
MVANPWNMIPSDYIPNIKDIEDGYAIEKSCKEPLEKMLSDCRNAGHGVAIVSGYRRNSTQITLYNKKVNYYLDQGLSPAEARKEAGKVVAMPGTSEHELGLAVDLVDNTYYGLDEAQENTDTQKWLMEHCWDYGFILRYPNNKSDKTGIIYEPWHYRYVGVEVA